MLIVLLSFVSLARASSTVSVAQGVIAVDDQSQQTQRGAAREAMRQVFIKMTGQRDIVDNPVVSHVIRNPQEYLRSYRFEADGTNLLYIADFDAEALTSLLKQESLPLWGQRRPDTLIWLALESDDGQRVIIEDSASDTVKGPIKAIASERGVPVVFPLMDLDDNTQISTYDVWGRFAERLKHASVRYEPDFVIGARLYKVKANTIPDFEEEKRTQEQASRVKFENNRPAFSASGMQDLSDYLVDDLVEEVSKPAFSKEEFVSMKQQASVGDYALDWVIISKDDVQFGSLYNSDEEALLSSFIQDYADYLGSEFAIIPTGENLALNVIEISVANIDSLVSYAHMIGYLSEMSVVNRVTLTRQEGSVATLSLSLLADTADFYNLITLDERFKPLSDKFGQPSQELNFYWNN
ncbi:DUF2066 domain-containing protein [Aestuariibacter sp. A3R04]|nr:DUF2066 domain-containing protein [Aestuariibacter sp. A3R04]